MKSFLVAERYAKALFELAVDQHKTEEVYRDARELVTVCLENRTFMLLMKSPVVSGEKKKLILGDIFTSRFSPLMMDFLRILVTKNRTIHILEIAYQLIALYKEYHHILVVKLVTAMPVTEKIRTEVRNLLHDHTGWTIELDETIDPTLIGGFILNWDDMQYDASIRFQIERLKRGSARINLYKKGF